VKFKKARAAAAVIEFLQFANRAVKFQAIALCLKPGARRKNTAAKQNTRKRVKFTSKAGEQICRNGRNSEQI
jgi:hypothetical protein